MANQSTGNLPSAATTSIFNNFLTSTQNISPNTNDAVIGFFEEWTGEKESAKTLAATVIYTATSQGVNPMEIINEFRKLNKSELSAYITMFLNINRVGTSFLGLSNSPQTNKYIKRAILP